MIADIDNLAPGEGNDPCCPEDKPKSIARTICAMLDVTTEGDIDIAIEVATKVIVSLANMSMEETQDPSMPEDPKNPQDKFLVTQSETLSGPWTAIVTQGTFLEFMAKAKKASIKGMEG